MNSIIDIRISEVKMQRSNGANTATNTHRKVKASTTLSRKYVKRPAKNMDVMVSIKRSPRLKHFDVAPVSVKKTQDLSPIAPATTHPMQAVVASRMQSRKTPQLVSKMTAKELKDQAIKKALENAAKVASNDQQSQGADEKKTVKMHFGLGRIILALSCAAAAVFAIIYFVNLNMPDISMRVAAMQTGIDATYPSYVPKDFNLSNIASEEGKIVLNFKNDISGDTFSLSEEKSSWDSSALLTNYVKVEYDDDYSVVREQGLTIYVSDNAAAWVNGGVVYKIKVESGELTKKQIRSIAVSL